MGLFKKKETRDLSDFVDDLNEDDSTAKDQTQKGKNKSKKGKKDRKAKRESKDKKYAFSSHPHLMALKPREKYVFHSDYFQIDNQYATILSYFHQDSATDNFGAFWGINRIPSGLDKDVVVTVFEQSRRMTEGWLHEHQTKTEGVAKMGENEHAKGGTSSTKRASRKNKEDLEVIAQELQDGASYLNVHNRLLIKAPTLEKLEKAVEHISRLYIDRFGTLSAEAYPGEQRRELSTLFSPNAVKRGKGFYYTSTEFAGSHSLVTHGLSDFTGEYIGYMVGDVNNSAVLFDVNNYSHHVVIGNENFNERLGRVHVADMWGSKIGQACMLNNGRIVHIVLDTADLDKLGPKFENITYKIDMNTGDVNMFEMFGEIKDELSIFPSQMQKLILMAEQAYETTDTDRSIIRGSLEEIATRFYIDNKMWYENAGANRDKLRVTGIPHEEVPKLEMFVSYLDTEYKALVNSVARDDEKLHALSVLRVTFKNMLSNNGDLFNTITNPEIDGAVHGSRVVYDFSGLMMRGKGVAMAQLVNIISYAVGNLSLNDTVIIHGADLIDDGIKTYLTEQFDKLYQKGGRVAFLYNNMDKMLDDKAFNQFDKADYTVFGNMTNSVVTKYQNLLGQDIPPDLSKLVATKGDNVCYIRRGYDNVVFKLDLLLGIKGAKKKGVI